MGDKPILPVSPFSGIFYRVSLCISTYRKERLTEIEKAINLCSSKLPVIFWGI
jgi:hypothetical protein